MEIDINQKKISIGDKYKIFINGEETYRAAKELFNLLPVINLFHLNDEYPKMTIRKRWSWLKAEYDITSSGNSVCSFRTKSLWRLFYQCRNGNDLYDIYGHTGRKYSVYKNGTQIAWWDKEAVSWFAGDNYKIIADNNCDRDLLISFCLIIDNFSSNDHGGNTVTIDFGNIGFQIKKFDHTWQPN